MADFQVTTPGGLELTALDFAEVAPGSSYKAQFGGPLEVQVKNLTAVAKTSRKLVAVARPPFVTHSQIRFSLDNVTYTTGEVVLGEFTAGQAKTLYCDLIVAAGAAGGNNQRCDLQLIPA